MPRRGWPAAIPSGPATPPSGSGWARCWCPSSSSSRLSLLLVTKGFTWGDFVVTFFGCVMGITALAAALSRYLLVPMKAWERWLCVAAAVLLIAPGLSITLIGMAMCARCWRQWNAWRAGAVVAA